MANPCGTVHMPSFPCRECDRVRKASETISPDKIMSKAVDGGVSPSDSAPDVPAAEVAASVAVPEPRDKPDAPPPSKSDRLAVAEEAVAETLKRYRAKAAARQKRYRERKKSDG